MRDVGEVANELSEPQAFLFINLLFHVSVWCLYILDKSHVLQYDIVKLDDHLTYIEEPIAILSRDVHQFYSRSIPLVKV